MVIAATGVIPTLLGAMLQEVVDTVSILSALRARKNVWYNWLRFNLSIELDIKIYVRLDDTLPS